MNELICIKWEDFKTAVSCSFDRLREDNDFVDVTLISDDKAKLKGHKVVLSACSPFFKDVLKENPHEHPLLYLSGVDAKALKLVLDYIYKGEVQLDCDYIEYFFEVAGKLQLSGFPLHIGKKNKVKDFKREEMPIIEETLQQQIQEDDNFGFGFEVPIETRKRVEKENSLMENVILQPDEQEFMEYDTKLAIKIDGFEQVQVEQQRVEEEEDSFIGNVILQPDAQEYNRQYEPKVKVSRPGKRIDSSILYQFCNVENLETKVQELMGRINGVFTCKNCGRTTRDRTDLRKHVERHINGLCFSCPKCSKKYFRSSVLKSHINMEHVDLMLNS